MKKIPYGISNFEQLITQNYLYIDKTKSIELLENEAPYQFFIRPRRFGKTLFLSMLENYYDILKKDDFERLFSGLYIGKNPTYNRNQYLVLMLDFSTIIIEQGKEKFIKSFDEVIIADVRKFLKKYEHILEYTDVDLYGTSASAAIKYAADIVEFHGQKMFIIIDEYDNFANNLISMGDRKFYYELLTGEGYVRSFYKTLKITTRICTERLFMTGVTPIMLDDLTSGFNITSNLTMKSKYNEILGFTKTELEELLKDRNLHNQFDFEELIRDITTYYNGYQFSRNAKQRVYNPNMVLYFINSLIEDGLYPENILDLNIKTDYNKIRTLALNFKDNSTIETLLIEGSITAHIVERFNLSNVYQNQDNFVSLLYYMGMLTIQSSTPGWYTLCIPNYVIKELYWEVFLESFKNNLSAEISYASVVDEMATQGSATGLETYLKSIMNVLSNRDLVQFDERYIKLIILMLFHQTNYYIIYSEPEVENGYIDILLTKNKAYKDYIKFEWLIELKYVKEKDRNTLPDILANASSQINKYSDSHKVKDQLNMSTLKTASIVVVGKSDVYIDFYN